MIDNALRDQNRPRFAVVLALLLTACGSKGEAGATSSTAKAEMPTASASAPAALRKVALGKKPPTIGVRKHIVHVNDDKTKVAMKGRAGGIDVDETKITTVDKVEECLELKERACSKFKVTYKTDDRHSVTSTQLVDVDRKPKAGDKPREKKKDHAGPNEGNTYIVTIQGDKPTIVREDGKPIQKAEVAEVKNAYDSPDESAELDGALPPEVAIGDKLDKLAELLAKKSTSALEKPTTTASVTVKDLREDGGRTIVTLVVDVTIEGVDKRKDQMSLHIMGTLEFAADTGETVKESFVTTLTGKLPRDGGELTGTMTETKTVTPAG